MLRRVAEALGATVHVVFESGPRSQTGVLSEAPVPYRVRKKS
jgi:hypothetical protein